MVRCTDDAPGLTSLTPGTWAATYTSCALHAFWTACMMTGATRDASGFLLRPVVWVERADSVTASAAVAGRYSYYMSSGTGLPGQEHVLYNSVGIMPAPHSEEMNTTCEGIMYMLSWCVQLTAQCVSSGAPDGPSLCRALRPVAVVILADAAWPVWATACTYCDSESVEKRHCTIGQFLGISTRMQLYILGIIFKQGTRWDGNKVTCRLGACNFTVRALTRATHWLACVCLHLQLTQLSRCFQYIQVNLHAGPLACMASAQTSLWHQSEVMWVVCLFKMASRSTEPLFEYIALEWIPYQQYDMYMSAVRFPNK